MAIPEQERRHGPEPADDAGLVVRNEVSAVSVGTVVQAGVVRGGLHVHPVPVSVVPRQLPAAPGFFAGRVDELADLDRVPAVSAAELSDQSSCSGTTPEAVPAGGVVLISAIGGAGGIGKTWLALFWAHQRLSWFPDGQLFVDLRGFSPAGEPMRPAVAARGFLDALGVEPGRIPIDLHAQAALFRSLVAQKRMLIVLDNAAAAEQVEPLLPGGNLCTVVVTSRKVPGLIVQHGARQLTLDALSAEEVHVVLLRRLGAARVAAEPGAVAELVELCGGFPLALGIIAGRAHADPHIPLAQFAMELRALGLGALEDDDPSASLPTVLSWSYQALSAEQQVVFGLLGIAPGPDIGLPAASNLTGLSSGEPGRVLRGLEEAALLSRDAHGRYAMHDLIRAYATDTAHHHLAGELRAAALRRVVDFYVHTAHTADRLLNPHRLPIQLDPLEPGHIAHPLSDYASALAWFDTEHPCLLAAQHAATTHEWHQAVWNLAWALHTFHTLRGHRHHDLAVWQAGLAAAEHLPDPTTNIVAHRLLGRAYGDLGQHDEAIGHLHQSLGLGEHHHDRINQAHTHRLLAWAWEQQGDDRPAVEHATHALDLYRTLNNPVWEADALNEVGWFTARLGDHDRAREYCQAALTLHHCHDNTDGIADTLVSLGYIDHHTGQHYRAIHHYQQALSLLRDLGHTYEVANTLDGLGHPHAALNQHDQARTAWRESLQLYQAQQRHHDADRVQQQLDTLNHPDANPMRPGRTRPDHKCPLTSEFVQQCASGHIWTC